jgi:hypothetical protein
MKNLILSVLGLVVLASTALAQTYTQTGTKGEFLVSRGYTSATSPVTDVEVENNNSDIYVNYRCGTNVSLSIIKKLADGTVLVTDAVACGTTPAQASYTGPLYFEKIAVSPTTAVSTTAGGVSTTVIETQE